MGDKAVRLGNWNDEVAASHHPDATVMLFSAWATFTRIISDPGSIWFDFMHPTSPVHNILAGEIAQLLASQPPLSPSFQRSFVGRFSASLFLTCDESKRGE
jgi:hypothetical protein